jgi:hypothetical protein
MRWWALSRIRQSFISNHTEDNGTDNRLTESTRLEKPTGRRRSTHHHGASDLFFASSATGLEVSLHEERLDHYRQLALRSRRAFTLKYR